MMGHALTPRTYAWWGAVLLTLCSIFFCFGVLALFIPPIGPNAYLDGLLACRMVTGLLCVAVLLLSEKDKRWQVWSSIALIPLWLIGPILLGSMWIVIAPALTWSSQHGQMLTIVAAVLFVLAVLSSQRPGLITNFLTYFLSGRPRRRARAGMHPAPLPSTPNPGSFESALSLIIQQRRNWAETVPLVEQKNQYLVKDASQNHLLSIDDTSFKGKNWALRKFPPFTFRASEGTDRGALQYHVPYPSFWRGEWNVSISDKEGRPLGTIRHPFFTIRKTFLVSDAHGHELYRVVGRGFWHWDPWEYAIFRSGLRIGTITNEWGGLAQEMLTDADTYSMTFRQNVEPAHKYLLLGALLLLDLRYFEES